MMKFLKTTVTVVLLVVRNTRIVKGNGIISFGFNF